MKASKLLMLLSALLFTILSGSIFLNFLLFHQAKKYYFELNETRLEPIGLGYYPVAPHKIPDTDQFRVIFFGDSRAASWIAPAITGYEFINRGIASQTSVQVLARFSAHVRPLKPDVVVIQVGVNDLKTISLFPGRRAAIIANCKANIKRLVEESRRLGAVVILTTVFPTGEIPLERKPFWSNENTEAIQDVNAYIKTLADDQIIVFDTFSILVDRQGVMMSQYSADELHLNEQGYTALNQEFVKLLYSIKLRSD